MGGTLTCSLELQKESDFFFLTERKPDLLVGLTLKPLPVRLVGSIFIFRESHEGNL